MSLTTAAVKSLILKYIGGDPIFQNVAKVLAGGQVVITKATLSLASLKATVSGLEHMVQNGLQLVQNPLGAVMSVAEGAIGGSVAKLTNLVSTGVITQIEHDTLGTALNSLNSVYGQYSNTVNALTGQVSGTLTALSGGVANTLTNLTDVTDLESRYASALGSSFDMTNVLAPLTTTVNSTINSTLGNFDQALTAGTTNVSTLVSQINSATASYQSLVDTHVNAVADLTSKVNTAENAMSQVEALTSTTPSQVMTYLNANGGVNQAVLGVITMV